MNVLNGMHAWMVHGVESEENEKCLEVFQEYISNRVVPSVKYWVR